MNQELSKQDEMSLAAAAMRGAPWKAAALVGTAVAASVFALGVIAPGPADFADAFGLGIDLFFLVAAIGAVARPDVADRVTAKARSWALKHPWRFSLLPGAGTALALYPTELIFHREGVFGAAWAAAWGGLLVYLITAVCAMGFRGRAQSSP